MTEGLAAQILMPLLLEMVSHCSQNTNKLFTIFHLALFGLETLVAWLWPIPALPCQIEQNFIFLQ